MSVLTSVEERSGQVIEERTGTQKRVPQVKRTDLDEECILCGRQEGFWAAQSGSAAPH